MGYSACTLNENDIALITTGYKGEQDNEFEMHIRTMNLPNMKMHPSQRLPNVGKTIPTTQVYLHPADRTMVQLSEILFPPGQQIFNHSFIEFHPYNVTQYNTTIFYEDNYSQLPYVSMDKQQDSCIIATGGNYGIIKDINNEAATPNCYHYEIVLVRLLNNRDIKARNFPYEWYNNILNPPELLLQHVTSNSITNCTNF